MQRGVGSNKKGRNFRMWGLQRKKFTNTGDFGTM